MSHLRFLNHPWHQLKFLSVSPLAQLTAPGESFELSALLARVGVFRSWPAGAGVQDRLPQLRAYLHMPGRGPRSRFCDGSFRTIYAGEALATCRAEVAHHHAQALRDSGEPPGAARIFECLQLRVAGAFLDLRKGRRDLLHPDDYGPSQAFGRQAWSDREAGIVYPSVRAPGGECLALFDPDGARACRLTDLLALRWDGRRLE